MDIVSEFILIINDDLFRVYDFSEEQALNTFVKACKQYMHSGSKDEYKHYWSDMITSIQKNKYQIIENLDFQGVRREVGKR